MNGVFSAHPQRGTLAILSVAFLLEVTGSRAYDQYTRAADCKRWHENVTRWVSVVSELPEGLTETETAALTMAHGGMIAVRNHVCGNEFP